MNSSTRTLYDYDSYRHYLRDRFLNEKKSSKKSTAGTYATQLGMSAASFSMILSGERNLTIEKLHALARILDLSEQEKDYFEALVFMEQLRDDPDAKNFYLRRLGRLAKESPVKRNRTSDKSIVSEWFVPALLIRLIDFERERNPELSLEKLDHEALGQKFQVTAAQIKKVVEALARSGLLAINTQDQIHIIYDKVISQFSQKNHVQAIHRELGQRIRDQFEGSDCCYRTFTFSMKKTALPELKADLIALFEKYMAITSDQPQENEIYQALAGIFPV